MLTCLQANPLFTLSTSLVSGINFWFGLSSGSGLSSPPTSNFIGIRFNTSLTDSHYMFCTNNGSSGQAVSSGIVPSSGGVDVLSVSADSTDAYFTINGTTTTITTLIPSASTSLALTLIYDNPASISQFTPYMGSLYAETY